MKIRKNRNFGIACARTLSVVTPDSWQKMLLHSLSLRLRTALVSLDSLRFKIALVSLHSLATRTDHGFLRINKLPQLWHCLFSFWQCHMHLQHSIKLNHKITGTY